MRRVRARCSDPGDAALIDLYRDHSVAPLLILRRRLRAVFGCYCCHRSFWFHCIPEVLSFTRQWDSIVAGGPQGGNTADDLVRVAGLGLADVEASVVDLHQSLG